MAVIFRLSSLPGDEIPLPDFRFSDKLVHFAAYAALGLAIAARRSLRKRLAGVPAPDPGEGEDAFDRRGVWVGMLYGLSDEVHQLFVPLRLFSLSDFAADALGVAAGIWMYGNLMGRTARARR